MCSAVSRSRQLKIEIFGGVAQLGEHAVRFQQQLCNSLGSHSVRITKSGCYLAWQALGSHTITKYGALAQLGERQVRNLEVVDCS